MATTTIKVPDIGDFEEVDVIEVLVSEGDRVEPEQSLITLESDKATMEVPADRAGTVKSLKIKVGDKVSEGSPILELEQAEEATGGDDSVSGGGREQTLESAEPAPADADRTAAAPPQPTTPGGETAEDTPASQHPGYHLEADHEPVPASRIDSRGHRLAHASPAVRRFARELGVDLSALTGSGRKGRILKEDVQAFVKGVMQGAPAATVAAVGGTGIPPVPEVDFAKFGEIEERPLSRIRQKSGPHLHRSWLNVPHVTQFDEADITELEAFRKSEKATAEKAGVKLTPLAFLVKAAAAALLRFPEVNSSLKASGEMLILKKYISIGVAVDTPNGLVVPVVRDADRKGIYQIAADLGEISGKAREGKLGPSEMQGGTFSISSLGGIGGTAFTPIVNAPEVAILGVSRSEMKPRWNGAEFEPRLMLPLSLSYDHRVIDGAAAARFTTHLSALLSDLRRLVL